MAGTSTTGNSASPGRRDAQFVKAMAEIFGSTWTSQNGVTMTAAWTHALDGLTGREIAFGLQRCAKEWDKDFPPKPGQFRRLCAITPEAIGLPSAAKAYREALDGTYAAAFPGKKAFQWSHQAVYHAAVETGHTALRAKDGEKVFERNYEIACRMVINGEEMRSIPKALPAAVVVPVPPEVALANVARIKAMLNSGKTT